MPAPTDSGPVGVFAAALTPVTPDRLPDASRSAAHCRRLLDGGCDGIGVLGTTGEAVSFAADQRRALLEALLAEGVPAARLIVGTGAAALADAVTLTRHAADADVAGTLVIPPFYYKSVSDDGVFRFYAELIERVGDPALRLYLYHFPRMSGVPITEGLIRRLCKAFPGVIAGIKDSSGNLDHMTALARTFPELRVFSGTERYLLPILEAGGAGCISAGANVLAPQIGALWAEWRANGASDAARAAQETVTASRLLLDSVPLVAAMKALIATRLGDPGWSAVCPPLVELAEDARLALFQRVEAAGLELA